MPAVYTAFTLLVYWQLWTPIEEGRGSWRYDPRYEYWQDLQFWARTWRDGTLAHWNPFDRAGYPLYGDPQPGLFYPLNWPLIAGGAIADSVPYWVIGAKILGHWVFGAIGMHLFARRLKLGEPSAYLAGMVFSFTSPKLLYAGSALNWSVAWLPWVLLAMAAFFSRPNWRRSTLLGSAMAMVLLAGAPAVVLYALLIATPFAAMHCCCDWRTQWRPRVIWLGSAIVVCALWWAPLVASNLEQLPESVRDTRDIRFVGDTAFAPKTLLGYLVPRQELGLELYVGLALVLLVVVSIVYTKNRVALLFLAVACIGITLALGNHTGFLPAVASFTPPFTFFRRAHRYLYIASFAWAVMGAIGLHVLAQGDTPNGLRANRRDAIGRHLAWAGAMVVFILAMGLVIGIAAGKEDLGSNGFALATVSAAVSAVLVRLLTTCSTESRRKYSWAVVVFITLDLWIANANVVSGGMTPNPQTDRDSTVAKLQDVTQNWRVYDVDFLQYRPGTRLAVRDFGGYEDDPLGLARYRLFSKHAKRSAHLLRHANVRYLLIGKEPRDKAPLSLAKSFSRIAEGVYEIPAPAPAIYWVREAVTVATPGEALAALRNIDPGRGAVVEQATKRLVSSAAPLGKVVAGRITELSPNRLTATISTPGPGWVVINEAYYPTWRATVNEKDAPIFPANAMFRAVRVESSGNHTVVMTLSPKRMIGLLPCFGMAVVLLLLAISLPRRKTTPPARAPTTERDPPKDLAI